MVKPRGAKVFDGPDEKEFVMPEKKTRDAARKDKREGKSASTQAGEYVHEEIEHVREGKHGARSTKQAIAIGLSKARADGVKVPAKKGAKKATKKAASKKAASKKSTTKKATKKSSTRSAAAKKALKREPRKAASKTALSRQAKKAASKRSAASRSASAKKAARTRARTKK
jgi:hypothetical protein